MISPPKKAYLLHFTMIAKPVLFFLFSRKKNHLHGEQMGMGFFIVRQRVPAGDDI